MSLERDDYQSDESKHSESDDSEVETVIIRFFEVESEAHIASAFLSNQEIPNFLSNKLMNQLLPFGQGSIALHVRATDADRAKDILRSMEEDPDLEYENLEIDLDSGVIKARTKKKDIRITPFWYLIFIIVCILILLWHAFVYSEDGFKFW